MERAEEAGGNEEASDGERGFRVVTDGEVVVVLGRVADRCLDVRSAGEECFSVVTLPIDNLFLSIGVNGVRAEGGREF